TRALCVIHFEWQRCAVSRFGASVAVEGRKQDGESLFMACCAHCRAADTQFDARRAERDLRQYKRRGVDAVTKLMLSELQRRPMSGCGLLDVGAGIGVISSEMAATGIVKATIVEASPAYLDVARYVVRNRYQDGFTQFVLGDFAAVAASLPDADAVTLGRV